MGMSIFVRARFEVRDGRRAEFEEVARALRERAEEEPGTRTYRWFLAGDGGYLVIEEYADTQAALMHNENVADLLARAGECAEMAFAELYGEIGAELGEWARGRPGVTTYPDLAGQG
jgi:quinol monooxygenase YgiN